MKKQESIPVGCVPSPRNRKGGFHDRDPPGQRLSLGQRSPQTETPHGERPPVDRQTPVKTQPSQTWFAGGKNKAPLLK